MTRAILRAQWLSMRWGGRRGAVLTAITSTLWYSFWCSMAYVAFVFASEASSAQLSVGLPTGLLLVFLYWQVVPVISGSMGSALDLRKLLAYPVPHRKLFLVEVLLRATTGMEMLLLLLGAFFGLLRNPSAGGVAVLRISFPLFLFVLFNLLFAAGLRSLLERLLSRRRVREALTFLILLAAAAPRLLLLSGKEPNSYGRLAAPIQSVVAPWGAAAAAALGESAVWGLLSLAAWCVIGGWFGRAQFERSLRYDAAAAQAAPSLNKPQAEFSWRERLFRLPSIFFRDPLAAIIEKELRSLSRNPRFRIIFVMGFSFGLMIWLPFVLGGQAQRQSPISQNFLTVVCVYALTLFGQVSYWNCFGFDRSAAQVYFASPQPMRLVLVGKNIASLVFVYTDVLLLIALTLALPVGLSRGKVIEALLVVAVCSLYMLAFGNVSSVQYPRPMAPTRVSMGGSAGRVQGLIFIFYPLALLPVFLAYLGRYAFDSELAFVLILGLAAALGGVLYWIALDSAVSTTAKERERLIADLSRGEGPVAE